MMTESTSSVQKFVFSEIEHKGQMVVVVNTQPELQGVEFTMRQVHGELFKLHEMEEILEVAKSQSEPQSIINGIQNAIDHWRGFVNGFYRKLDPFSCF